MRRSRLGPAHLLAFAVCAALGVALHAVAPAQAVVVDAPVMLTAPTGPADPLLATLTADDVARGLLASGNGAVGGLVQRARDARQAREAARAEAEAARSRVVADGLAIAEVLGPERVAVLAP